MKTTLLTFLFTVCLSAFSQTWTQKANCSLKNNATAFSIGNFGYLATGSSPQGVTNDLQQYDPNQNLWTTKAPFPGRARETAVSFTFQNEAYVGLGWNGSSTFKDFYAYNSYSNTWRAIQSFPGQGGRNGIAAVVGNKAYVSGGVVGYSTAISNQIWELDLISGTWSLKTNMPFTPQVGATAFSNDSLLFIGMGHNFNTDSKIFWSYNPSTNVWSRIANFPGSGRLQASVFEINGEFVVGGGHRYGGGISSSLNDYYAYDPDLNAWSSVPGFAAGRRTRSEGFTINNKGYVVCGSSTSNNYSDNLWEYSSPLSVGIENQKTTTQKSLILYPNPTENCIYIRTSELVEVGILFIYNSKGTLVIEKEIKLDQQEFEYIEVNNLKPAIYFCKLMTNGGLVFNGTFIKK